MPDLAAVPEPAQPAEPAAVPAAAPAAAVPASPVPPAPSVAPVAAASPSPAGAAAAGPLPADAIEQLKASLAAEIRATVTRDLVREIIATLSRTFLGQEASAPAPSPAAAGPATPAAALAPSPAPARPGPAVPPRPDFTVPPAGPTARERFAAVNAFAVRRETCEVPVWTVKLGATRAEGGTRGRTYTIGGQTAMPFHLWEGEMPNRPLIAMEVFDTVSEKYPPVLRRLYGDLLQDPPAMARACVEQYGADLIAVRLDGTHPEKGNRSAAAAVDLVRSVLAAVDVPLIVTGHNHFDKNNEVMKAVAQACAGENLLLNWVEQDNYRTIAGAALAYGHAVVAQSPIDVNIAKQLTILLTSMDLKQGQIVMDPMTGAMGYGLEYTYSVMERIRLTGLGGDRMLAGPMIGNPGQECAKIKEFKAAEKDFPAWGDLERRAALWETATASSLLYAGADILVMYHPQAAIAVKQAIFRLMDGTASA